MKRPFLGPIAALVVFAAALCCQPVKADWLPNLLAPEDEAKMGAEQAPEVTKQFGGVYENPELARYVTSIGQLLASTVEEPNVHYTFTILNSPIVNAFSLPGGYVYVTRGLLALADDEAEVAGVMAHELGHINAHHSAQRYSRTVFAQLGLGLLGAVTKSDIAGQLGGTAAQLVLMSYSREQEFEADSRGVRYMSRAGFDPHAMAGFLSKLQSNDALQAQIAGHPGAADKFNLLATHPRTADRVERAIAEAGEISVKEPVVARDIYLRKLDGVVYGDDPEQGIVRGQKFIHPKLRFAFEVPAGFSLMNSADAVIAIGPQNARIEFDLVGGAAGVPVMNYLTSVWAKGVQLRDVETLNINNMQAATGWARLTAQDGTVDVRPVAISFDRDTIARLFFEFPSSVANEFQDGLRRTTYSFRRLASGEAEHVSPNRLRIVTMGAGDSVQSLSARQPFESYSEQRFRVLNGLGPNDAVKPGTLVKVVSAE